MERETDMILDQLRLLELQLPLEKKDNLMRMVRVYLEVLKRCPYLAETPKEEQKEMLRILKEEGLI